MGRIIGVIWGTATFIPLFLLIVIRGAVGGVSTCARGANGNKKLNPVSGTNLL
jgi:hypothetical protein